MGGLGSTRWGGHVPKTTVEECLTLPMGVLADCEGFRERRPWAGELTWTKVRTGEETATIGYQFFPRGEEERWDGHLRLKYPIRRPQFGGEDKEITVDCWIDLETTPYNFGGGGGGFGARS